MVALGGEDVGEKRAVVVVVRGQGKVRSGVVLSRRAAGNETAGHREALSSQDPKWGSPRPPNTSISEPVVRRRLWSQ